MALGKSLGNILGDYFGEETVVLNPTTSVTLEIDVNDIETSKHQTRTEFDQEKIKKLAFSIKQNGLIHPIVVLKKTVNDSTQKSFRLLVGERRLRATKLLGLPKILAVVREEGALSNSQQALVTAMENLEREDLSPIELANTFEMLMKTQNIDEQGLSEVLKTSAQYVKNYLRLLTLSQPVQDALLRRKIGEGQARHLVGLEPSKQVEMLKEIIEKDLTVKEIIALLKKGKSEKPTEQLRTIHNLPNDVVSRAQRIAEYFPKAKLQCKGDSKKGQITIKWG
jgi:ParB family chromosome partitioning protein